MLNVATGLIWFDLIISSVPSYQSNAKVQDRRRAYTRDVLMKNCDPTIAAAVLSPEEIEDEVRSILAKTGLIPGAAFKKATLDAAMKSGKLIVYLWMSKM